MVNIQVNVELQYITQQLINRFNPYRVLLFGSQAKNKARRNSDIDLCIITETTNKRDLLTDMYLNIESNKPFDLLLYTPEEWENSIADHTSFAYQINREGIILHG